MKYFEQGSEFKYQETIQKAIPSLESLDNTSWEEEGTRTSDKTSLTSSIVLNDKTMEKDWKILQDNIKRGSQFFTGLSQEKCIV